jgi:hypothetical protein
MVISAYESYSSTPSGSSGRGGAPVRIISRTAVLPSAPASSQPAHSSGRAAVLEWQPNQPAGPPSRLPGAECPKTCAGNYPVGASRCQGQTCRPLHGCG